MLLILTLRPAELLLNWLLLLLGLLIIRCVFLFLAAAYNCSVVLLCFLAFIRPGLRAWNLASTLRLVLAGSTVVGQTHRILLLLSAFAFVFILLGHCLLLVCIEWIF